MIRIFSADVILGTVTDSKIFMAFDTVVMFREGVDQKMITATTAEVMFTADAGAKLIDAVLAEVIFGKVVTTVMFGTGVGMYRAGAGA